MQDYRVGICDNDTGYVIGFMEFINMKEDIPLKISAFSKVNAISEYKRTKKLDLLLLDQNAEYEDSDLRVIRLTDNKELKDEYGYIYKYQSLYEISKEIIEMLNEGRQTINANSYVYGVYSPLGRSGKTNLARGICEYYQDSFYVGFEEYSGFYNQTYKGKRYREIYERFLYYLTGENVLILDTINEIYEETGIKAFVSLDYTDLKQIDKNHVRWLADLLQKNTGCKRIVFDIGTGVFSNLDIMLAMDKLFVPVLKDKNSVNKLDLFKNIMSEKRYAELEKKVNYVEVPRVDFGSRAMKDFIIQSGM